MLLKPCIFLLAINYQYPQFYHVSSMKIFINNLVSMVQNLFNSFGILNEDECVRLKYFYPNCLLALTLQTSFQVFNFSTKD